MGQALSVFEGSDALKTTAEEFNGHMLSVDGDDSAVIEINKHHWAITNIEGTKLYKVTRSTSAQRFVDNVETKQYGTNLALMFANRVE